MAIDFHMHINSIVLHDEKKYIDFINNVVALGEIGLDNTKNNFNEQRKYLIRQIIMANELHLPVIIHSNNCNKQIIDILKDM